MTEPMTEQSGPYVQAPTTPGLFDLGLGQPSPSLLPHETVAEAAGSALRGVDRLVLQYGAIRGHEGFRRSLGRFLTDSTGLCIEPDSLMVTAGISAGLALVSDVLGQSTGRIAAGDPTYFLARGIFETAGLEVVGIPVDEYGLNVDALRQRLEAGERFDFVYCIPAYHNPCSVSIDPKRARALVDLADAHDFIVVADEPYLLLNFGPRPLCLVEYDAGRGRVLSLGSFSKILAPGLRLGWMHAAPSLIERISSHGVLRSGGGVNPVGSVLVHPLLDDGFLATHVQTLRATLRDRARALGDALERDLPAVEFERPDGGYFAWIRFPEGVDTQKLDADARARYAVGFTPGTRCAVSRDLSNFARLSFAFYDGWELSSAVRRLADAYEWTIGTNRTSIESRRE